MFCILMRSSINYLYVIHDVAILIAILIVWITLSTGSDQTRRLDRVFPKHYNGMLRQHDATGNLKVQKYSLVFIHFHGKHRNMVSLWVVLKHSEQICLSLNKKILHYPGHPQTLHRAWITTILVHPAVNGYQVGLYQIV